MSFMMTIVLVLSSSLAFAAPTKAKRRVANTNNTASVQTTQTVGQSAVLENATISENNFIPRAGQSAVSARPTYIYRDTNFKSKVANQTSKDFETIQGTMMNVRYDRGFGQDWGFFAETGAPLSEIAVTRTGEHAGRMKGMTDIQLGLNHVSNEDYGQLVYGGVFTLSPGDRVWGGQREDGNFYSGGNGLSGHVGVQKDYGTYVAGGRFRLETFGERSESYRTPNNVAIKMTRTPGNVYAVEGFTERPWNNYLVGGLAGVDFVQSAGFSLRPTGQDPIYLNSSAYNVIRIGAYGRMAFKGYGDPEILPSLQYGKVINGGGGTLAIEDTTESSAISITGRWAL